MRSKRQKNDIYLHLSENVGDAFIQKLPVAAEIHFCVLRFAGTAGAEKRAV